MLTLIFLKGRMLINGNQVAISLKTGFIFISLNKANLRKRATRSIVSHKLTYIMLTFPNEALLVLLLYIFKPPNDR